MERTDIKELHYITPITNVPSIMKHGILSNKLSVKFPHNSVAMEKIQNIRKNKRIPGAGELHEYANLYFDAHNPMLSKRRNQNNQICVLRISPDILDLPEVVVSDQNAASNYVRFYPASDLSALDKNEIFARSWKHSENQIKEWSHSSAKCAEVLVPDVVQPINILGAYVANNTALKVFQQLNIQLTVSIKSDIFF